jgi:ribosomal protein S18 acetylase RimI-like enzyme
MAERWHPEVSLVFPEHYDQAAMVLGRAFADDPPMLAILGEVPDPSERARRLAVMFSVALAMNRRRGQPVFGVFDRGRVVAAAVVEGVDPASFVMVMLPHLHRLPRLVAALGWDGVKRALRLLDVLARNHPVQPHLYLNLLGVDPDHQRRHYGIAILDHLRALARARGDLAGVYLETATPQNVAYYQRAGYEVLGELNPLGVRMWRMMQPVHS